MSKIKFRSQEDAVQWILNKFHMDYDASSRTLFLKCDAGLFSNCSSTLCALVHLAHLGVHPEKIDASRGFFSYKDHQSDFDVFSELFVVDPIKVDAVRSLLAPYSDLRCPDHHTNYAVLPLHEFTPFVNAYFAPSQSVASRMRALKDHYQIDYHRTTGLCFRGTDKSTEVTIGPLEKYARLAIQLAGPRTRTLIQTDQQQARDFFLSKIPNSFFFEEMPTTATNVVLHKLAPTQLGTSKLDFAKNLIAATLSLSMCNKLINHCGNMALWLVLFRGTADGMFQFDRFGRRVGALQLWHASARNLARRMRRWATGEIAYYV